jgi:hypothetical protein
VQVLAQFRRADELDAEAAYYSHRAHATGTGPGLLLPRRTAPVPGYRPVRDGAAATDWERSDVMSSPVSSRGPLPPPGSAAPSLVGVNVVRPRRAQVDALVLAQRRGSQVAHLHLADPSDAPAMNTWYLVGAASPVRSVPGAGGPRIHWHRGVRSVYPARQCPQPVCSPAKPRHPETTKTAPRTTVPRPGLWQTTDVVGHRRIALLSSHAPAEQIDLPQPRSKGLPT